MRNHELYLKDILNAFEAIEKFDYNLVWETIKERLPRLIPLLRKAIEER